MRFQRAEGILEEEVDGRCVLVTPDGVELLTLNETGTILWRRLAEPATADELAGRLAESFDVDVGVLAQDAAAFVDELRAASVVVEID